MIQRRSLLASAATLPLAAGLTTLAGCGGGGSEAAVSEDAASRPRATPSPVAYAAPTTPKARVVVVGGGMAGVTAAKYLRMWGDQVDVTLVDKDAQYTSCIMSSLVLTGQRSLSSLVYSRAALASRYGARLLQDEVRGIDPVAGSLQLASGKTLTADRIVLAPGIEFDDLAPLGLTDPNAMPHAWKAGPQTTLLAQQLRAMPAGGTVILTIPLAPYRCPPGPYERACLIADWLKVNKPGSKLVVLDANADFVAERDNFSQAFFGLHASVIEYHNNALITGIDTAGKALIVSVNGAPEQRFSGAVINLIPRQRAPSWLAQAGLVNAQGGRFAGVNVLDYSSTAAPGKVHVIGDSSATTQPKAGHIANQEAKILADALSRIFAGGSPDPAPVTNSACYSTITMTKASWLHALFQYNGATGTMQAVPAATGASVGWNGDHFEDMGKWFNALMADSFA